MSDQYIVLWRKPPPENTLDWDFHVCRDLCEAETVVQNIKAQGVWQYSARTLGGRIPELSSEH